MNHYPLVPRLEIQRLKEHWNAFGETDPLWAIRTEAGKRGGGWDLGAFFLTGRRDVEVVFNRLAELGLTLGPGRALDFGCGVGRLTQALAERFESCDGIDIAASMIERANDLNRCGDRCRFHLNETTDLRRFEDGTFDFVLSLIVLQHMEPRYIRAYMCEFMRVLRPGGVAFFNVPFTHLFGIELPADAKRASLSIVEPLQWLETSRTRPLLVQVVNRSPVEWPHSALVFVGSKWHHTDGATVSPEARALLGRPLGPGEQHELALEVTAPSIPGDYELEVDLLQEHIAWFGDAGSPSLRIPITVGDAGSGSTSVRPAAPDVIEPTMEMYTMPEAEVVAELEHAGGVVCDVRMEDRCGPTIPSLDYVVVKSLASDPRAGSPAGAARFEGAEGEILADRIGDALEAGRSELLAEQLAKIAPMRGDTSVVQRQEAIESQTEFNETVLRLLAALTHELSRLRATIDYLALTDRIRGSREEIKARRRRYVDQLRRHTRRPRHRLWLRRASRAVARAGRERGGC